MEAERRAAARRSVCVTGVRTQDAREEETETMVIGGAAMGADGTAGQMPPAVVVAGDWQVRVTPGVIHTRFGAVTVAREWKLRVSSAVSATVRDEKWNSLQPYNAAAPGWNKGDKPAGLFTYECTAAGMLEPGTFTVKSGPGDAPAYVKDKDYGVDEEWGTFGRLNGAIGEKAPVWLDYTHGVGRLDTVVVDSDGSVSLRKGKPMICCPKPPSLQGDEIALANIWVPGRLQKLTPDSIFTITETAYPVPEVKGDPGAARLLPKTWAKLQAGEKVRIMAWGDSVTAGGQASDDAHRYQSRFVAMLRKRFPKADIQLTTNGWGGRATTDFLAAPTGHEFNFEETVIAPRADLITMEFVNDAHCPLEEIQKNYDYILKRFQETGVEWVIITPHFVRPDWMGLNTDKVTQDPRPYVKMVKEFAAQHNIAMADASRRWEHLAAQGIPPITLEANSINHPDDRGHEIFALALMELFGGKR